MPDPRPRRVFPGAECPCGLRGCPGVPFLAGVSPCAWEGHAWPSACGRPVGGGLGPLAKRLLAERSKQGGSSI
eukprot:8269688-Pyramimonas_sp.AAC.1